MKIFSIAISSGAICSVWELVFDGIFMESWLVLWDYLQCWQLAAGKGRA